MGQAYSDPKRAEDPHALPNVEVFYISKREGSCPICSELAEGMSDEEHQSHVGWYWWPCFPGCLPDGEPIGPFATEAEALADAQGGSDDE